MRSLYDECGRKHWSECRLKVMSPSLCGQMRRRVFSFLPQQEHRDDSPWCDDGMISKSRPSHRGSHWNYPDSLIFTLCGWLPAVAAASSLHQQLGCMHSPPHKFCLKVKKTKYEIFSSTPSSHPQRLSILWSTVYLVHCNDALSGKKNKKYCLINVPERTLVISADPAAPHLLWQFLGNCLSHYFISDTSSYVRLGHNKIHTAVILAFVTMLHWANRD